MGKILFWFIIILAVLLGARMLSRKASGNNPEQPPRPLKGDNADMSNAEAMVRCQHCGIHLPRSEAYLSQGQTWCGPEHARIGQTPRS